MKVGQRAFQESECDSVSDLVCHVFLWEASLQLDFGYAYYLANLMIGTNIRECFFFFLIGSG